MRRRLVKLVSGVLAAGSLCMAVALAGKSIDVPTGIRIPVKLDERISSQDAKTGQSFVFETTAEVKVGDIVVPAGTLGHGVVELAESARGARPGKLNLAARSIDLADGRDIPVAFPEGSGTTRNGKHGNGAIVPIPLPIGVVFVGGGQKPTNIVFEKGAATTVETVSSASPPPAATAEPY